jgi:hypothetical protein
MAENAREYAAAIAAEVLLWAVALDGDGDERDAARAEVLADMAPREDELWWTDYLDLVALDVTHFLDKNGGNHIVEVLRTYGGPTCRIVRDSRDGDGWVTVEAAWGSDEVGRVTVYARGLAHTLDESADIMAGIS